MAEMIPDDISEAADSVIEKAYSMVDIRDYIVAALMAERKRCSQAARDYLANEYMPDFGSLPDDLAAAILATPPVKKEG